MHNEKRSEEPEERLKEIVMYLAWGSLSFLCLFVGYLLEHFWQQPLASHISNELGIAVLVAIILAVTIEHVTKKRDERRFNQQKEAIKNDVFEHVLGYRLPEGTFAELDNQILGASFIRRDYSVSYKLTPIEPDRTFMKLEGKLTYKIFNVTPERKHLSFVTAIDEAPLEELNSLVKFISVNVRGEACPEPLKLDSEGAIRNAEDRKKRPNHIIIEKDLNILPQTDAPNPKFASATIRFVAVDTFDGGNVYIITRYQTLGFELKVEAPEDVDVFASAYLPEPFAEGDEHLPTQNNYHWTLKRPILPFQGIYLTWKCKPAATPAP